MLVTELYDFNIKWKTKMYQKKRQEISSSLEGRGYFFLHPANITASFQYRFT